MPDRQKSSTLSSAQNMILWLVVLAGFTGFFVYVIDNRNNPNQKVISKVNSAGKLEVELKRNSHGHYVAPGKINGQEVMFLLDSGATSVGIPKVVADKLLLNKGISVTVSTANGTAQAISTRLQSVSLGNIRINNVSANIIPGMEGKAVLLGMSFLRHLELTQRGEILKIAVPEN